jgi:hypothetical protein
MEAEPDVIRSGEVGREREGRFDFTGGIEPLEQVAALRMSRQRQDLAGDPERADAELMTALNCPDQRLRIIPRNLPEILSPGC